MLVTLKELLQDAEKNNTAVGMFDVFNLEMLIAVIEASEITDTSLIIAIGEDFITLTPWKTLGPLLINAANLSKSKIAVHLDHGTNLENIKKALNYGFTSVMFDGSLLSFENNIKITKQIVELAKITGASVEAELGHVGGQEGSNGENDPDSTLTNVILAEKFVEETKIDCLAVAIGTAHGNYSKNPHLDFKKLNQLYESIQVPLVLHGASGLSDEDIVACINQGIRKINIWTDLNNIAYKEILDTIEYDKNSTYYSMSKKIKNRIQKTVIDKLILFNNKKS